MNKLLKRDNMKKIQILSLLLFTGVIGNAQTNTFPTSGNVGIGSVTPMEKLDVTGNIFLRNMENLVGGGVGILFSSYGNSHPGPRIKSYLDYASGEQSRSRLVLSSYYGGYKDELTLMNGNVGIGTTTPNEKLSVNGKLRAHEVKVETQNWPDYVFKSNYKTMPLPELKEFIRLNEHLPEMPTAKDAEANGIELGRLNKLLLKKVEELTLILINQHEKAEAQDEKINQLTLEMSELKKIINK